MADLSEPRVQQVVLERVLLTVRKAFGRMELESLGHNLRGKVFEDLLTREVVGQFQTWLMGGNFQDVHFEREARFHVRYPMAWQDHAKEALLDWLIARDRLPRLRDWIGERIRYYHYTDRQVLTDHRRVPQNLCPHGAVPVDDHRGGEAIHVAWMDGREDWADRQAAEYLHERAAEIATDMDVRAFLGRKS